MSRRAFIRAVGIAAGAAGTSLILPGCAPAEEVPGAEVELGAGFVDTSQFRKDPPWNIGRSGMGEVNSWQVISTFHFEYFVNQKYEGLFNEVHTASAFFDPAQQIADMEDLLTKDLDVMLVQPVTGGNITALIEEAMGRGIPVVLIGARAYTDNYVSYLDRDNPGVGRLYTNWIADKLGGEGQVAVMMGLAGNTYAEDVLRGVRDTLALFPDMEEAALGYGVWSPVEGKEAMEAMLASTDQIDGIINDGGNMGIGIVDAYLDAGLEIPYMCGDDGNGWLRKARDHDVEFLAVHGGAEVYGDAVDTCVKVMRGEPVAKNVLANIISFTNEELEQYYRPDLNDQFWAINQLPEDFIQENYAE